MFWFYWIFFHLFGNESEVFVKFTCYLIEVLTVITSLNVLLQTILLPVSLIPTHVLNEFNLFSQKRLLKYLALLFWVRLIALSSNFFLES